MLTVTTKVAPRIPKITVEDLKVDMMRVLSTQSITNDTEVMMEVIMDELAKIPNLTVQRDDYGNVYVTKGKPGKDVTFPAYVCHTDTVHKIRDTFTVVRSGAGHYFAYTEDDDELMQVGVGGDDKCGIILCLELLHRLKTIKCAFFLDEEQGCKGSKAGKLEFFDDCRFAIQIDRKGGSDIITTGSGVRLGSDEFITLLNEVGKVYQYSSTTGMNTDVVELKKRGLGISACNLSAGYYNPHSKQEYINERELFNCLEFCIALGRIKTVYPHKYVAPVYEYTSNRHSGYTSSGYTSKYVGGPAKAAATTATPVVKKCLDCAITLSAGEGVMCTKCMHSNLHLQVYGDLKRLVVIIPSEDDGEDKGVNEPSTSCKFCQSDIIESDEVERGYCSECGTCRSCGQELKGDNQLDDACCPRCLDEELIYCKVINCKSTLHDPKLIELGYCEICLPFTEFDDGDTLDSLYGNCRICDTMLQDKHEATYQICYDCLRLDDGR